MSFVEPYPIQLNCHNPDCAQPFIIINKGQSIVPRYCPKCMRVKSKQ